MSLYCSPPVMNVVATAGFPGSPPRGFVTSVDVQAATSTSVDAAVSNHEATTKMSAAAAAAAAAATTTAATGPFFPPPSSSSLAASSRVSFHDRRMEVRVASLACLSDELRNDIWYSQSDIESMRTEARDLCRFLRVNPQACPEEHTRGLELRISLERQCRKQMTVQGVVEAQRRCSDPAFLACLAQRCSMVPRELALAQAQRDYCTVYDRHQHYNHHQRHQRHQHLAETANENGSIEAAAASSSSTADLNDVSTSQDSSSDHAQGPVSSSCALVPLSTQGDTDGNNRTCHQSAVQVYGFPNSHNGYYNNEQQYFYNNNSHYRSGHHNHINHHNHHPMMMFHPGHQAFTGTTSISHQQQEWQCQYQPPDHPWEQEGEADDEDYQILCDSSFDPSFDPLPLEPFSLAASMPPPAPLPPQPQLQPHPPNNHNHEHSAFTCFDNHHYSNNNNNNKSNDVDTIMDGDNSNNKRSFGAGTGTGSGGNKGGETGVVVVVGAAAAAAAGMFDDGDEQSRMVRRRLEGYPVA